MLKTHASHWDPSCLRGVSGPRQTLTTFCCLFSSSEQSSGWAFVILECLLSVVNNFVVTTLQTTFFIQSSLNLLRIFIFMISRTNLNMDVAWWSKSGSRGQILVKLCFHSAGHCFDLIFITLAKNVYLDHYSDEFEHGWSCIKKKITRSNLSKILLPL